MFFLLWPSNLASHDETRLFFLDARTCVKLDVTSRCEITKSALKLARPVQPRAQPRAQLALRQGYQSILALLCTFWFLVRFCDCPACSSHELLVPLEFISGRSVLQFTSIIRHRFR